MIDSEPINNPKLYLLYLGGPIGEGRIGEDHEVVMVVANSQMHAMSLGRNKWKGQGKAYVDRVILIEKIDGWQINLSKTETETDIFSEQQNDYSN